LETAPSHKASSFRGDVLRLVSGTAIAQAIGILAAPIVARLYAPEDYGIAATFISIVAIIGVVACLRYELSIVLPDNDREAANLFAISLLAAALVAALIAAVIWFAGDSVKRLLPIPEIAQFLWLVPVAIFVTGTFLALNYWNSRTRHFTRLSVARVSSSLVTTSAQLGAGVTGFATGGSMIAANVGGQVVAVSFLGFRLIKSDSQFLARNIRWREMLNGLKRYRKFPIYSTWSGLLNTASWQLPVLMLGAYFSPAVVGFYVLGFRLLQIPMNLVGGAVSQVFLQRAGEASNKGTLEPLVEGLFRRLVLVGMFPMLVLSLVGEHLYIIVFGENWAQAGIYTQILSIWAFVWFVSSPLARLFFVLGKQEFSLALNGFIFATRLASLAIGGYFQSIYLALALFAATGFFIYGYQALVVLRSVGVAPATAWRVIGQNLLYFVPFGVVLVGLTLLKASSLILTIAAGLSMAIFGAFVLKSEFDVRLPKS
jgi:O-antigen/teichoic acid export membrane protein